MNELMNFIDEEFKTFGELYYGAPILDELIEYSEGKNLTFVEWAEFSQDQMPFDHLKINVTYSDDDSRIYTFEFIGNDKDNIIERLINC